MKSVSSIFSPIMSLLGGNKPPSVNIPAPSAAAAPTTPSPVNADALEQSRLAALEEQRRRNRTSLRIDLSNPGASSGGAGVFIPQ